MPTVATPPPMTTTISSPGGSSISPGGSMDIGEATDPGVEKLLSSLDELESKVNGTRPDLLFLKTLLESAEFKSLLSVHNKVTTPEAKDPPPIYENASDLVTEVCDLLSHLTPMPEAQELDDLLHGAHFQALLDSHDQIALRDFQPQLPEVPYEVDEDEESVKIVRLIKGTDEPLGATIHMDNVSGRIKIARIMHGGAADRSGLINCGDEVHEVNKVKVAGKTPTEVVKILSGCLGPITLKLVPGDLDPNHRESRTRVRALFTYRPTEDQYIPCKEAGLAFTAGDVLHIVSQEDSNWWQARREGDRNMRAGLIPARQLQERKEVLKATVHGENKETKIKAGGKFSPKLGKKSKKNRKITAIFDDSDEILTYEEVEPYNLPADTRRAIVLVGASGVGCSTLRKALVDSNPDLYSIPPLSTSCPKKSPEADDGNIHLSRVEMEKELHNKKFYEHWEQKGQVYGRSVEQVKTLLTADKIPVITASHAKSIRALRTADIKPYYVFVKPPSITELKSSRSEAAAKCTDSEKPRSFTDHDFEEMIATTEILETHWSGYFDHILVNSDLSQAVSALCEQAERSQGETQWVPSSWIHR